MSLFFKGETKNT